MKIVSFCLIILILFSTFTTPIQADDLSDVTDQLNKLKTDLANSQKATQPLESDVQKLTAQLNDIKSKIAYLQSEAQKKEQEVTKGEEVMTYQKKILDVRTNAYYKNSKKSELSFLNLLTSDNLSESLQNFFYQKTLSDKDKVAILKIAIYIHDLETKKDELNKEKAQLSYLQSDVDKQSQFLNGEISKAKKYQSDLSSQIADLSAKQQSIINARSGGGFIANIGDSDLADDYNASIAGFRASAPGGYFAVFSFGAYTHRNGMSQYGALGRVKNSGWNSEQLLKYYYPGVQINHIDSVDMIVSGTNSYGQTFNDESFPMEEYLKHIYEVPASWPSEVLKAQAIAARTYAYNRPDHRICPGQGCQEMKREENSDAWKQAVQDTQGQIMSGGPGSYQYSSTTGGWINNGVGWDTTDGQGGGNFVDKAYEKIAGSPWVYKAWYTQNYRNTSDKCGRSNPWLSPQEMADIVNAALVMTKGTTDEASRISPTTTSCWGGNPYSMDELRNIASKYGGISSADSVSVSQGNGTTNSVTINGITFSGSDFKRAFSLRAPAYLSIPQGGFAFFNIEKK